MVFGHIRPLAVLLLLIPQPLIPLAAQYQSPDPPSARLTHVDIPLQFVPINQPDYNKDVLAPIRQTQAIKNEAQRAEAAREQAAAAAQASLEAAQAAQAAQVAQSTPPPVTSPPVASPAPTSSDKLYIYENESGNRTSAINPSSGACGLGQAEPCSKLPCSLSDYACQDVFFTNYAISRYGSWANAAAFWRAHSWW